MYPGLHLLATLLALLFTANLIYIGWHTIARGTIPIGVRPFVTRRNVSRLRSATGSLSTISTVAWTGVLFVGCMLLTSQITVPYTKWANYLLHLASGSNAPLEVSSVVFGRQMAYIQCIKWLILLEHFPVSMSVSILGGMLFGLIRKRPVGNVTTAIGLLFWGPVVSLMLWSWLVFAAFVCRLSFLYYASYLVFLPAGAVFLNLSRTVLLGSSESKLSHAQSTGHRTFCKQL